MDQAEGLRRLMMKGSEMKVPPLLRDPVGGPKVFSVTSGKGGVGKTNVVANLAYALTQMGKRVLVVDADLGLANIDILLGLTPRYTIKHFFSGEKGLSEILIRGPGGMSVMPASCGVPDLVDLDEDRKILLFTEMEFLAENTDILLIDTGAGISSNVLYFNMAAQESIVVVTSEPTSITDAYALIKVLSTRFGKKDFMILVNCISDDREAVEVFRKISLAADHFLPSLSIDYLGFIPFDEKLPAAVKHQRPVLEIHPMAPSSRSLADLARTIAERAPRTGDAGSFRFFWKRLLQMDSDRQQQM